MRIVSVIVRCGLLVLFVVVAGCAVLKETPPPQAQEQAQTQEAAPAQPPLEQYVASARLGEWTSLAGTRYGDVDVSLLNDYFAASGKRCRLLSIVTKNKCNFETVFCYDEGQGWKETPRIWGGCSN
jgi:hypothetical protein